MNKEKRKVWWAAIRQANTEAAARLGPLGEYWFSLCHICRYPEWQGQDGEDGPLCTHPVRAVHGDGDRTADVWAGCDCWGFRPKWSTPQIALEEMREQIQYEVECEVEADE